MNEPIHLSGPLPDAFVPAGPTWIDHNGALTELRRTGEIVVIYHYDDIPECDRTVVHGIPVTTPLRTIIDIAPEETPIALHHMVADCLERSLFTIEEAKTRLAQPDMLDRPGARILRHALRAFER